MFLRSFPWKKIVFLLAAGALLGGAVLIVLSYWRLSGVVDISGRPIAFRSLAPGDHPRSTDSLSRIGPFKFKLTGESGEKRREEDKQVLLPGVRFYGPLGRELGRQRHLLDLNTNGRDIVDATITPDARDWREGPGWSISARIGPLEARVGPERIEFELSYVAAGPFDDAYITDPFVVRLFPSGTVEAIHPAWQFISQ